MPAPGVGAGSADPALLGSGIGRPADGPLRRGLRAVLYGISPDDPLTLGSVALVIAAVALAACLFPARRALRMDPSAVLRQE